MKFNEFFKQKFSRLFAVVTGALAAVCTSVTAMAADGTNEAVSAAKSLLDTATGTMNIGNIVAIVGAGIGAVIGLFLAWWGARKLVHMLMGAFKKGKVSL